MNYIKKTIIFLCFLLVLSNSNRSVADILTNNTETQNIEIGFSRLNNIWNFTGNINLPFNTSFGNFHIKNIYQGIATEQTESNFRDAEFFLFEYHYPIFENIFAVASSNLTLLSDLYSTKSNALFRLSGLGGFFLKDNQIGKLKLLCGMENNKQIEIISNGFIFKGDGDLEEIDFDGYKFSSKVMSEFVLLKDERNSKDFDFSSSISKTNNENLLSINAGYKFKERNFLQDFTNKNSQNAIEIHKENKFYGLIATKFLITKNLATIIDADVENIRINRYFNKSLEQNNLSLIYRNYNELKLNFNTQIDLNYKSIYQSLGVKVNYRTEENLIEKHTQISNDDFISLQNLENQKNNISTNFGLFYKNMFIISPKDTLLLNASVSKLEYDTPSKTNNDDRDEFYALGNLIYKKRFSDLLTLASELNLTQNHLVFIKKERSAQNNWNRIIQLKNTICFDNKILLFKPTFEVLANYNIYDFESEGAEIKSYSFRQISYKDSLRVKLNEKYAITNKSSVRYYEQGKLFWNSFSEIPQRGNLEIMTLPAVNVLFNEFNSISVGFRFFFLEYGQIDLSNNSLTNVQQIKTYSPDVSIFIKLNKLSIKCYGYLEYQFNDNSYSGINPNLFLQTSYNF